MRIRTHVWRCYHPGWQLIHLAYTNATAGFKMASMTKCLQGNHIYYIGRKLSYKIVWQCQLFFLPLQRTLVLWFFLRYRFLVFVTIFVPPLVEAFSYPMYPTGPPPMICPDQESQGDFDPFLGTSVVGVFQKLQNINSTS